MRRVPFTPETHSTPVAFPDGSTRVKGVAHEKVTVGEVLELEIGDDLFQARVLEVNAENVIEAEVIEDDPS